MALRTYLPLDDVMDDFNRTATPSEDVRLDLSSNSTALDDGDDFSTDEFIPPPAPSGWRGLVSRVATGMGNAMKSVGRGIKYVAVSSANKVKEGLLYTRTNPVSTGIAITAASVNAVNALTAPADISPEDLGTKWWQEMSHFRRGYSIASAISALNINTIMNARFIPQAGQKLKNSLADMRRGCSKILLNIVSVSLGLGAGIAQGSIAYSAYLWLPLGTFTAAPIALLAAVVTFSGRYLSVKSIISRIMNLFNRQARLQHRYADLMEHVNPYYLEYLEMRFHDIMAKLFDDHHPDHQLTDEEYQSLIQALAKELHDLQHAHPDFILGTTTKEYAAKYAGLLADVTLAILCATSGFMTFDQKGFDGVNTIAKLANNPLDTLNAGWRGLIGANPGVASFMFFGNHSMDIRRTSVDLVKHLYQNPGSIPGALILLTMNGIGATSMKSVGQGVIRNTNNIFSLTKNAFGSVYLTLITLAGAVGNGNTIIKSMVAKPEPSLKDLNMAHVIKRLNNADDHPITEETADSLQRNSLFAPGKLTRRANTPVQVDHTPTEAETFNLVIEL